MDDVMTRVMQTGTERPSQRPVPPMGAVWADPSQPPEVRARALIEAMTREEMSSILYGRGLRRDESGHRWQAFVQGIERLGVPDVAHADSPAAILVGPSDASQVPSETAIGASFDQTVARRAANIVASEARALGYGVLHAPTLDVTRDYRHGRAHENFGEDVHLVSRQGEAFVRGVHDAGMVADIKHFGLNTVETNRVLADCIVDDDRLIGHYLAPFRRVLANVDVWTTMTAYAKVNGVHVNDSPRLLPMLRDEWGFRGIARTDANAVHSLQSLVCGLDQEFRDEDQFGRVLLTSIEEGTFDPAHLEATAERILATMCASGLFDNAHLYSADSTSIASDREELEELACRCTVLLKNEGHLLPIDSERELRIAVIGPAATSRAIAGGPTRPLEGRDTFLEGIAAAFPKATVVYSPGADPLDLSDTLPGYPSFPASELRAGGEQTGARATYRNVDGDVIVSRVNPKIEYQTTNWAFGGVGTSTPPPPGTASVDWSAEWHVEKSATREIDLVTGGRAVLSIDGTVVLVHDGERRAESRSVVSIDVVGGVHSLTLEYTLPDEEIAAFVQASSEAMKLGLSELPTSPSPSMANAEELASTADVAIVVVRDFATEALDRSTLALPGQQDELIKVVAAANPRTIVVLATASAVLMPWRHDVGAIIEAWYGGSRGGHALGAMLSGRFDMGGRLPVTFPEHDADLPTHPTSRFPGIGGTVLFDEPETGYRYFDRAGSPRSAFPFGYGLSYTTWSYRDLSTPEMVRVDLESGTSAARMDHFDVEIDVHNTGSRTGRAVIQVYMGEPGEASVPLLVGYHSGEIGPGIGQRVRIPVAHADLARYSAGEWSIPTGLWTIQVMAEEGRIVASVQIDIQTNEMGCVGNGHEHTSDHRG